MSHVDIDRWVPERWDQVVGNEWLVEHYQNMIRTIREDGDVHGLNTLVVGESGEGKTSTTRLFARSLLCKQFDSATLNPCDGTCESCRIDVSLNGQEGVEVHLEEYRVHYLPIDCTNTTEAELVNIRKNLWTYDGVRLIWFDEVDELYKKSTHKKLLKPVEEKNYIWLFSTAHPEVLDKMMYRRFQIVRTELPTTEQLSKWLADRCLQWNVEWDAESTLVRVAERANRVPSLALNVLKSPIKFKKPLTRQHVERFIFEPS